MKKILTTIAVFAASVASAQGPDARVFNDSTNDLASPEQADAGFDVRRLTLERKGSSRLEITFETEGVIPKAPKSRSMFITYFDADGNPATGRRYGDIGVDLTIALYKEPAAMQWQYEIDRISAVAINEEFHVVKYAVQGRTASITVASPLFKKIEPFVFYAESIVKGKTILDRIPDGGFLRW